MYTRRRAQRIFVRCVTSLLCLNLPVVRHCAFGEDPSEAHPEAYDTLRGVLRALAKRYGFVFDRIAGQADADDRSAQSLERMVTLVRVATAKSPRDIELRLDAANRASFLKNGAVYVDGWALSEIDIDIVRAASGAARGVH